MSNQSCMPEASEDSHIKVHIMLPHNKNEDIFALNALSAHVSYATRGLLVYP